MIGVGKWILILFSVVRTTTLRYWKASIMEENEKKQLREAQSILTSSQKSLTNTKVRLDFLLPELEEKYQGSDLEYDYCVIKFSEMQAAKRDTIPIPTMKVWFVEFVKLGWTKFIFDRQYDALIGSDTLGYAIKIDHWINAVPQHQANKDAYDIYKPLPETKRKRTSNGLGLREFIDKLDDRLKIKAKYYFDKSGKKVYYSELPYNYKSELLAKFRAGDRIKSAIRKRKK